MKRNQSSWPQEVYIFPDTQVSHTCIQRQGFQTYYWWPALPSLNDSGVEFSEWRSCWDQQAWQVFWEKPLLPTRPYDTTEISWEQRVSKFTHLGGWVSSKHNPSLFAGHQAASLAPPPLIDRHQKKHKAWPVELRGALRISPSHLQIWLQPNLMSWSRKCLWGGGGVRDVGNGMYLETKGKTPLTKRKGNLSRRPKQQRTQLWWSNEKA